MISPCELIAQQMSALFVCSPHDGYTRVRTPYLYPDGDVIDLFVKEVGGRLTVTDLGETLRWFRMQTTSLRRSPKQQQVIEDVCMNHGIELFRGTLVLRVSSPTELSGAIARMSQAALRVSDLWFSLRNRAVQSVTDEVAEFLTEREIKFDRAEKLPGRSGRIWTIDFHTWTPGRGALVSVLSTGSRATAKILVERAVATWYDLSHLKASAEPLTFISLFDDTIDVWSNEDLNLASSLSEASLWSNPDEFERLLKAA